MVIEIAYNRVAPTFYELLLFSMPYLAAYILLAILIIHFRDIHRIKVHAADTDNLTGLHSARSFYVELANELLRSKRYEHPFSLAYLVQEHQ